MCNLRCLRIRRHILGIKDADAVLHEQSLSASAGMKTSREPPDAFSVSDENQISSKPVCAERLFAALGSYTKSD
jgi:hypothetical protein